MNTKIQTILEFDKVKDLVRPHIQTQLGQDALSELMPMTNSDKIQRAFDEVRDLEVMSQDYQLFSLVALSSLSEAFKRLELAADLNISELLSLKRLLFLSQDLSRFYHQLENVTLKVLNVTFEKLEIFPELQGLMQAINDAGFVEDFASPTLSQIRRQLNAHDRLMRERLQEVMKTYGDFLADNLIASRNGRNVLPIKHTYRNRVPGVVHDVSSSGQTVYIEPRSLVQLHEEWTQLQADERYEVAQILRELSEALSLQVRALRQNAWLVGQLDLAKAKYLFMKENKATIPSLSLDRSIRLLQVRHPLLTNPVANDLHFSEQLTALIITGPNTGGKTLMLKTLGLAQLMAQSGLPIFADQGSLVGVFHEIFADIGDEQSIEQNLSTFSSHMTHIVSILKEANQDSLILFDELGAGTDPQEGAALAMSILEHLRLSQIKTMATTHYPELKAYAIENDFVSNASMEFDVNSLRPTYRFMQGVPGRSNAFEIARRLGLPNIIVTQAEGFTSQDKDVNRIIERLEQQTIDSHKRLQHIKDIEQENLKFNRAVKKLYNEFSHARDKELQKAHREAQEIVELALTESDLILKQLHDKATLKPHEIIEAKQTLKKLAPSVDLSHNKVLKKAKKKRQPQVGDNITVLSYGQRGTLVKSLNDGRWEAQVGLIKMTLKTDEFDLVKSNDGVDHPKKKTITTVKKNKTGKVGPRARLDLRGKRYEEAMQELDAFIDQALLNNMAQVDIIHGIGTGVIRDGVTKYLRRNKHVKQFAYAPQNAGGSGATIVTFK